MNARRRKNPINSPQSQNNVNGKGNRILLHISEGTWPFWRFDFKLLVSELWDNTFLLLEATRFVVLCYGSPIKQTQCLRIGWKDQRNRALCTCNYLRGIRHYIRGRVSIISPDFLIDLWGHCSPKRVGGSSRWWAQCITECWNSGVLTHNCCVLLHLDRWPLHLMLLNNPEWQIWSYAGAEIWQMLFDMDVIFFPMKLGIYLVANFLAASKMLCTMYHYLANLENKISAHLFNIFQRV